MYNRYIRNDEGTYTRIPEEEASPSREERPSSGPSHPSDPFGDPPSSGPSHRSEPLRDPPPRRTDPAPRGESGMLQHLLDQLHLDRVDTGDLLLLGLLFLLFREGADDEVLAALGLLLIL